MQGKQPFRITRVECDNDNFQFDLTADKEQVKTVHLVPILFVAGSQPGKITGTIRIETDLHGGATTEVRATAMVAATEITAAEPPLTSRSDP